MIVAYFTRYSGSGMEASDDQQAKEQIQRGRLCDDGHQYIECITWNASRFFTVQTEDDTVSGCIEFFLGFLW